MFEGAFYRQCLREQKEEIVIRTVSGDPDNCLGGDLHSWEVIGEDSETGPLAGIRRCSRCGAEIHLIRPAMWYIRKRAINKLKQANFSSCPLDLAPMGGIDIDADWSTEEVMVVMSNVEDAFARLFKNQGKVTQKKVCLLLRLLKASGVTDLLGEDFIRNCVPDYDDYDIQEIEVLSSSLLKEKRRSISEAIRKSSRLSCSLENNRLHRIALGEVIEEVWFDGCVSQNRKPNRKPSEQAVDG